MINVGIIGATGYTALELIKILLRHPNAKINCVTSRENLGESISTVHPQLRDRLDVAFEEFDVDSVAQKIDFAFCCLPHAASAESVMKLRKHGIKIVDFSADYRLSSKELYEQWYNVVHPDPESFGKVPYGLPEFFKDKIIQADLVANPGCFPTSAILGIAPLVATGLIESSGMIVDSKTGVSGAGRKAKLPFHFPECNESTFAYNVGCHRHQPEIADIVERSIGKTIDCLFTPHLVPMDRGILSTIYANLVDKESSENELLECLRKSYAESPFVRITNQLPSTKDVSGTNYCDISVRVNRGRAIIVSCLDNLIKGASGAAVQNFNLMSGFDETLALI